MKAAGVVLGMMLWVVAGSARAEDGHSGLSGLDGAMDETGKVGDLSPRSDVPVGLPSIPDEQALRHAPTAVPAGSRRDEDTLPSRPGISEQEFQQTEGPVANCRIEVARRRRVAPAQISAGTVVLRFTIEPSGRVHDAEAVWAANTDLDVAACAKRVLSEWTFAKHAAGDIHVEHVYHLADARLTGRADRPVAAVPQ